MNRKTNLTLGSLFDGSGGFPLGGILSGITPIWASEVEPFAIRVTTKRIPGMKHYGDISQVDGSKIEPVDIITFGSPCQDMSVAGKRGGLDGSRSRLFYEAIRIIKEMREEDKRNGRKGKSIRPRYVVWENVPGAFSSNDGEDFRCVLESICRIADEDIVIPRCERWKTAGHIMGKNFDAGWRVLDAQYWGVPQRRRRIYLVADLAGRCAGQILFNSEGLSGYSSEGFRAWQRTARSLADCSHATGFDGYNGSLTGDKEATLGVDCGMSTGRNGVLEEVLAVENHAAGSRVTLGKEGKVQTLTARMGTGGGNVPMVLMPRGGCEGGGKCALVGKPTICIQGSMIGRKDENGPNGSGINEDKSFTLNATDRHAVCFGMVRDSNSAIEKEVQQTLCAQGHGVVAEPRIGVEHIVRRLTPTECARLQGFPDWWCRGLETENQTDDEVSFWYKVFDTYRKIAGKGCGKTNNQVRSWLRHPYSDSAEYKLWGNGVALPCVYFVLSRIVCAVENEIDTETLLITNLEENAVFADKEELF